MAIDFSKYKTNNDKKPTPSTKIDLSKYKNSNTHPVPESSPKIDFSKYKNTENPVLTVAKPKKKSVLGKVVDTAKAIDRNVESFLDSGANKLTFGLHNKLLQKNDNQQRIDNEKSVSGTLGGLTGDAIGIGKLYKGGAALTKALLPNAGKLSKLVVPGAIAGAGYQGLKEGTDLALDTRNDGNQTLVKRGLNVAGSAALFAGGDLAIRYAAKGVKAASDATGLTKKITTAFTKTKPVEGVVQPLNPMGKPTPQTLSEATSLKGRIKETQKAVDNTQRKINNLNKNITEKGINPTPKIQERMGVLSKELSANKAILGNRMAKLERTDVSKLRVDPVDLTPENVKSMVDVATKDIDLTNLKDFSGFKFNTTDVYRNFKSVFKDKYDQVKNLVLDPFDSAKKDYAGMQETLTQSLKTNVVDKLGITKGSKLSALVQDFGEKQITLDELKAASPKDWGKVVEADAFFRKTYDDLLDQINATRAKIYPRNPEKQIPKRDDYYRHFREFNSLVGLKNIFDSPAAISSNLEGISEFTTPKSKFAGFMQKRGMGPYKKDSVGGFLEYIPGASYATHIDPHINVFKSLGDEVAKKTEETKNLNNFINYMRKYSQDLAGKTNAADRYFQDNVPGGRKTMGALNWINSRVKTNVILGNVASSLAQVANVPTGIAFAKRHAIKGAGQTLASLFNRNITPVKESGFLNERFMGSNYRQFDTRWFEQPKKAAEWLIETADRMGTEFVWNSARLKGIAEGATDPIKYADDATRSLIAGRGIGEVPLLQKSKLFQMVAPFQLEVANLWRVQKDFVNEKDFTAIALLFTGNFVFNKAMEELRGSGVVFDPIQSVIDASKEGLTPLKRVGRLAGEVLSNVPLGQTLASVYPEYGTNVLPTRKELFGKKDPTRFGTGIPIVRGVQDYEYLIAPSFGGNQIKKTVEGTKSLIKGGDENKGKLKFPIEKTPSNIAKTLLFGPSATKEGKKYYNLERRPLSENQTTAFKNSSDPKGLLANFYRTRELDKVVGKMDNVSADRKISDAEREKKMNKLRGEFAAIQEKYEKN